MKFDIKNIKIDGRFITIECTSRLITAKMADFFKQGKEYVCEIKEKRKKRSLDANAYFWTMCGKLSAKLGIPNKEIYRELIREVGDNFIIGYYYKDDVEEAIKYWQGRGIGWIADILGQSGDKVSVVQYYGSSEYDTKQMSRLIDLLIDECKAQDIDTLTDRERSLMLERWNNG